MFSFLKKAPVEVPVPQVSNKDRIAKVVREANASLENITKTVEARKNERRDIQNKLAPLSSRAADLQAALDHAESMLALAPTDAAKEKIRDLAGIARLELEENTGEQKELRHQLDAVNSFLEVSTQQVTSIKARLVSLESDFDTLDVRESEASILRDINHVSDVIHDYRREVFTAEAYAELSQS